MKGHRPWPSPNPGRGQITYIPLEIVECENELLIGKPMPPLVELTPSGGGTFTLNDTDAAPSNTEGQELPKPSDS